MERAQPSGLSRTLDTLRENLKSLRDVFRGNVGIMAISWLLFSLTGSFINPFFAKYAKDLGASDYDVALMRSLGMLALALSLIPGGLLTDYIGRVKVIIIGTALVAISQFLFGLAPDWRFLMVVYIFDNAAHFYQPALTAIIMDSLKRGEEFKGFIGLSIVTSIPSLFMPLAGGFLYDAVGIMGIRYGFYIQGIIAVIVLVLRVKALRETFSPLNKELGKFIIELAGYRGVLSKAIKLYLFTSVLWQVATGVSATYMSLYVLDYLGLSKPSWGLLVAISTLGNMIASLYLVNAKLKLEPMAYKSALIVSLSLALVALPGYVKNIYLVMFTLGLISLVSSVFSNILGSSISAILTRILPPEVRGRAVGVQRLLDNLGASLGAQIAAFLYTGIGYSESFIVSGVIGAVSSIYLKRILVKK